MAILDLFSFLLMLINAVVVPLVFAVAFLLFIIGAVKYFFSEGGKGREEGRKFVLSAVLGFFFMIAIWGLVNVVVNTFGFNQSSRPNLPYFGGSGGPGGFFGGSAGGGHGSACQDSGDCRQGLVCDPIPCDGRCPQCVSP